MTMTDRELIERLESAVIDWDGSQEVDGADLVRPLNCGEARAIAARLRALTAEPVAAYTIDYTGCYILNTDIARIEKIAAEGSKGPTEVVYLYGGPPPATAEPDEAMVERAARAIYETRIGDGTNYYAWGDPCFYAEYPDVVDSIYAEARAALSASPRREGWRPIETAPKDGTRVLLARVGIDAMHTAFWRGSTWHCGGLQYFNNPTHWQPLPSAPQENGK
mgnify:CR=1 FL=1